VLTGWTSRGTRAKKTVSAKTEAEAKRRLRKLQQDIDRNGVTDVSSRTTVKQWVDQYLELRRLPPKPLSPNGWNAAASPLRKWVVTTIGNKRLDSLTPGDIRAVAKAQYDAGLKTSTAAATHRALMTALNRAVLEGHSIPERVLKVESPGMSSSDRTDLTLSDSVECLAVASQLPDGIRWLLALLYGVRLGEALGLVENDPITNEPLVDFDNKLIHLAWQLQDLQREHGCVPPGEKPSCGKKKGAHCPAARFRVPRDYEAVQLRGMWHLVRPKSQKGYRVLPMIEPVETALRTWLDEVRPANEWGLVFPGWDGNPKSDKVDREEWLAIQQTAAVEVDPNDETRIIGMNPLWRGHPSANNPDPARRRWYHIHECRNYAATAADAEGISDLILTSLLGHASIRTTRGYQRAHLDEKREAVLALGRRLGLPQGDVVGDGGE
jgi:integrase